MTFFKKAQHLKPFFQQNELGIVNHLGCPRLPLPTLEQTLERYLLSVQPHCQDATEFAKHREVVNDFASGQGKILQYELEKREKSYCGEYPHHFIQRQWDDMYLELRCPLPVHVNPGYLLKRNPNDNGNESQCDLAARFVRSSLRWLNQLKLGQLSSDGLCMSQFNAFHGFSRIPLMDKDSSRQYNNSRHIVVLRKGNIFTLDVLQPDGTCLSEVAIRKALENIVSMCREKPNENKEEIGLLTSEERDTWASHRFLLSSQNEKNATSLEKIDSALLVIALDCVSPSNRTEASQNILHSISNRWYDKTNFIFDNSGGFGVNFEHSPADGASWNQWIGQVWCDMYDIPSPDGFSPLPHLSESNAKGEVLPVSFDLSQTTCNGIHFARRNLKRLIDNTQMTTLNFEEFGKNELKERNVSPDAVVQLAFQLAYSRVHSGNFPATYEPCSMRRYWHGRTETIRSGTLASKRCIDTLNSKNDTDKLRKDTVRNATNQHALLSRSVGMGAGIDRHLTALKLLNEEDTSIPVHPLFTAQPFTKSQHWVISTSNISSYFIEDFTFGPVVSDGYGIGYQILSDAVPVNITAFRADEDTDSDYFSKELEQSLQEIKQFL